LGSDVARSTPTTPAPKELERYQAAAAQQNEINAASHGVGLAALQNQVMGSIRYPYQKLLGDDGYRINFVPGADAPSPEYFGNTFGLNTTTGALAGPSYTDIYVQPGESMSKLEAVTAFELGHEQWAQKAGPAGGLQRLINAEGREPGGTFGPYNDQPENAYLSGLYSQYFSNKYSPGVGDWATVGATPAANAVMNQLSNL